MITKISKQDFETKVVNDAAAVVDFSATWCGPCRMLAPVLEEISEELGDKAKFYNVDVDEDSALAAGFGISSVPTVLILMPCSISTTTVSNCRARLSRRPSSISPRV